jgi:tetratricopeptide (TPR) repeat protein
MLSVAAVLKPDEPTIFATLSALAMELGDPQLGELHAQAALRLNPKHAVAMNNLAEAVKLQGRRSEAAGHHRHACELDPNNASWLRAWVLSLAWLGQFAEAEQHAARLVTLPQHTKEDQEMLAQVRENRAADEALAKQANRRCATLGPPAQALRRLSGDGAIAGYARDLLLANREQECQTVIQHLERSPAGKAAGEIVRGAQLYLRRQGVSELREAVQHFDRGLPSFLADADVARHFGLIVTRTFFCLGEHEKALEWAQRFLAVDASNPYLVSMIAQLMRLLGRPQPEIDQAVSSYKWRFMLRQAPLAIAASALPLSLLACMPMPVWLQAILSMICAAGSSGLTMWQFRDRVPKPYREDFGVVVAGGSVLLVVLTVLITAHGIFGRIVAVIWYGLLALIPGGALMESGEAPEKKG